MWHMRGCAEDGECNLQHQGCVGHPGSLTSSGEPRLSQQQCEVMHRESIGSFLLPGIQMSPLTQGSNQEKTPKYQPRGSLGSKRNSTEQCGIKTWDHAAAAKHRHCQHHLGLAAATASSHPKAASSCLVPLSLPHPMACKQYRESPEDALCLGCWLTQPGFS